MIKADISNVLVVYNFASDWPCTFCGLQVTHGDSSYEVLLHIILILLQ